uniref:TATA element modulatory factor 1 TATA binding domain-containing protein n=1 Tax=Physcomitrium patens TaxID=3218 RepID=A0A7I4FNR6_PHYPA
MFVRRRLVGPWMPTLMNTKLNLWLCRRRLQKLTLLERSFRDTVMQRRRQVVTKRLINFERMTIAPGRIEVERTDVERSEDHGNAIHGVHAIVNGVLVSSKYLSSSDLVPPSSSEISHPTNGTHAESGSLRSKDVIESQPSRLDTSSQGGDKIEKELKMMEAALLGAAKQAQSKADEISRLMLENEQLKASLEELKVYALTKERDMLRREQNRKSDSSVLLKEKDEIIKAVMAEGEELSKKQAFLEGTIKKLRTQVRELEEEKNRLTSKLQVEEAKVESMRKDKAVNEKALQDAVEKCQVELASQKELYNNALNESREAAALAEARVDNEARADLDRRLKEASEREATLGQNIDELRQALTRTEQQAAFREDMSRNDIEDLEKRCQAAEARYEELSSRMPESTRPLLRHIEALQQAEVRAAAAQEKERVVNERLNQTLSRMAVMEAQVSCVRAEQAQLQRSLEKERQRASENRQEYLTATEAAATHEGRARQLEEEIKKIRKQYKTELHEEKARREALEQEVEQERAAMAEYEKRIRAEGRAAGEKAVAAAQPNDIGKALKRWPSMSSQGSVEESLLLQTSFDTHQDKYFEHSDSHSCRFSFSDRPPSPAIHFGKFTYEQLESHLRQKEGEVASYASRLVALELAQDSLAEELVKSTTQFEQLRAEANLLPGMRAELESLRLRHTSALELMGERDEEVEELRADLADVKHMYREQIDMLVGQIERLSSAVGRK